MDDLNCFYYYDKERSKIIKDIRSYINRLQVCEEISKFANLPLLFDEFIEKLDGIINLLMTNQAKDGVLDFVAFCMRFEKELFSSDRPDEEVLNSIINYIHENLLSDEISSFERVKESISRKVNSVYQSLISQLSVIEERDMILTKRDIIITVQRRIIKMSSKLIQEVDECIHKLKDIESKKVISIIEDEILLKSEIDDYIEEKYGFWSSLFDKDEIEKEIIQRFKNANIQEIIEKNIQIYYNPILQQIESSIRDYNEKVDKLNSELEELGIKRFKFPKAEYKKMQMLGEKLQANQVTNQVEVERAEIYVPVVGFFLGSILGGAFDELILGALLGPVGLVGGILVGTFFASSNARRKKEEVKQKIRELIHNSLNALEEEIDKLTNALENYINHIKSELLKEVDFIIVRIIKTLEGNDLDAMIEEIKNQLNALKNMASILKIAIVDISSEK